MTNLNRCYNIFDLREVAQRRLPKGIFEYVDKGTEDGISLEENRAAFQRIKLRTRFLNDWSKRDLGTEIFGKRIDLPFGIAPTGSAGLMWYQGEVELARAAAAAGIPFTLATGALTSLEEVDKAVPDARKWFQLYPWEDEEGNYEMVTRARDLGWEALVVTIDAAPGRGREHNERNGYSFPFTAQRYGGGGHDDASRLDVARDAQVPHERRHAHERQLSRALPPYHHRRQEARASEAHSRR